MPATRIDTRRGWIGTRRIELLEAMQRALIEGLRIPLWDRVIVLNELDPDAFLVPPNAGDGYMTVEIVLFSGRSLDAKSRLYAAVVAEMADFGIAPADVKIMLVEVPRHDWGLQGRPGSEIELAFEVNI